MSKQIVYLSWHSPFSFGKNDIFIRKIRKIVLTNLKVIL